MMKWKSTTVVIPPYLGPFPAPKLIVNNKPDQSDPLNQFVILGLKWYEATQFGFVFKQSFFDEVKLKDLEAAWLERLPAYVARERKRRRWKRWPLIGWFVSRRSKRDLENTFSPDRIKREDASVPNGNEVR
jgi:hypothetical protein